MISMYAVFLLTIAMLCASLPAFMSMFTGHIIWIDNLEPLSCCAVGVITSLSMFLHGFGKIFGIYSDYDCLKRDNYQLEFLEFGDRLPDTEKHPYYVTDIFGTQYICPIFLDYRNTRQRSTLICVHLHNGKNMNFLKK